MILTKQPVVVVNDGEDGDRLCRLGTEFLSPEDMFVLSLHGYRFITLEFRDPEDYLPGENYENFSKN